MNNHCITVYLGDTSPYLSRFALNHDPNAILIQSHNRHCLDAGVYYTSIGDLDDLGHLEEILQQADEIVYAPPDCWSDSNNKMQYWTEEYLRIFACDPDKTVKGFVLDTPLLLSECQTTVASRMTDNSQIWIVGCSVSHGFSIQPNQRYGHIVSERLNLPASYLTMPGSSIMWAADQILRSDIRSGDKIFWGVTGINRLTYWDDIDSEVRYCALVTWNRHKKKLSPLVTEKFLTSDHVIYQSTLAVRQVVNLCNKLGVEIVIATVMPGMEFYLRDVKNFVPLVTIFRNKQCWLDLGDDNEHPGPKSHAFYAEGMIKKYLRLYVPKN